MQRFLRCSATIIARRGFVRGVSDERYEACAQIDRGDDRREFAEHGCRGNEQQESDRKRDWETNATRLGRADGFLV